METAKNIGLVLLGIIFAVGIYCLTVAIGCAVNGISFQQQIVDWFGPAQQVVEEVVEQTSGAFKFLI